MRFSCSNGNSLVGAAEVACLASGNWNAPIPFCESVLCADQVPSGNSSAERVVSTSIVSREVDGKALFSCPSGYSLKGPDEAQCLSTGEWSHPTPRCEGKRQFKKNNSPNQKEMQSHL